MTKSQHGNKEMKKPKQAPKPLVPALATPIVAPAPRPHMKKR